jgi:hypothetical protein
MLIERLRDTGIHTLSRGAIYAKNYVEEPFRFVTLEPTNLFNLPWISCIPTGTYVVVKHVSPKFGECLKVKDVEGRSDILIHTLNFFKQTNGCIGPGTHFSYIDEDNSIDVANSGKTLTKLMSLLPDEFELEIREAEGFQKMYTVSK